MTPLLAEVDFGVLRMTLIELSSRLPLLSSNAPSQSPRSLARAAALIFLMGCGLADALVPLIFAHRALAAAAILALTAGLIVVFLCGPAPLLAWVEEPRMPAISL